MFEKPGSGTVHILVFWTSVIFVREKQKNANKKFKYGFEAMFLSHEKRQFSDEIRNRSLFLLLVSLQLISKKIELFMQFGKCLAFFIKPPEMLIAMKYFLKYFPSTGQAIVLCELLWQANRFLFLERPEF